MKLALSSLLLGAASAFACGPFFPNTVLDQPAATLQAAPIATFARELEPLRIPSNLRAISNDTAVAAQNDFRAAELNHEPLTQFADYQRGADLWRAGNTNDARAAWTALLKRPANERRYRSTWAAFMIGKSHLATDPAKSIPWFRRTRELAADGFLDTLGLAASSLGWEAQAELRQNRLERASTLYLQQLSTGDGTAVQSLRIIAERTLAADPREILRYAHSSPLNQVVTAWLVSRETPPPAARAWLVAVEDAGVINLNGADRLAWLAYQTGDAVCAVRWLKRARTDTPIGQWIRAKLLLRDGKLEEGTALLAKLVRQFPQNNDWHGAYKGWHCLVEESGNSEITPRPTQNLVAGELAVLQMSRCQFTDALDLLLRSDYWWDAAYVAERVLSTDELKRYVDQRWPKLEHEAWNYDNFNASREVRWLLARRLARLGRLDEARPYYPERFGTEFDKYAAALRAGKTAAALWEAARQARYWGMTLLSTELDPDWHCVAGQYAFGTTLSNRLQIAANRLKDEDLVTCTERQLVEQQQPTTINERFHYRYLAANLAWDAAQLMPDNNDDTARVLCEAGTWLKNRDPKAADRFYKELVKRCGKTELGKAADKKRWFPPISEPNRATETPPPNS